MGTAYISHIDITTEGKVVVSGQLSRTNLSAKLTEMIPIMPPADGIWSYELEVVPTSLHGATMMIPFSIEAPWIGDGNSNGVRIIQPSMISGQDDKETILLKGKKVKNFTQKQLNSIWLKGAYYNKVNKLLVIDVKFGGGCFLHQFVLEWNGVSLESFPPQYNFNLVDISDYDPCKALKDIQLQFDISTPDFQIDSPSIIYIGTPRNGINLKVEIE